MHDQGTVRLPLAGPSPVDRRKGGLKRSVATEAAGIPLGIAAAGANRHDAPLLAPTLHAAISQLGGLLPDKRSCHLDATYHGTLTRQTLAGLGIAGQIAAEPLPILCPHAPYGARTHPTVGRHAAAHGGPTAEIERTPV